MKNLFILFASLMPLVSSAQQKTMVFTARIKPVRDLAYAELRLMDEGAHLDADSVGGAAGVFTFKGRVDQPVLADLVIAVQPAGAALPTGFYERYVYLEPGNITLTSTDSLRSIEIQGSALNRDFLLYGETTRPASDKLAALDARFYRATGEQQKDTSFRRQIAEEKDRYTAVYRQLQAAFIRQHPESLISLDALVSYAGAVPDVEELSHLFNGLSSGVRNSVKGRRLAGDIQKMKRTTTGSVAPDFTLPDSAGMPVSLHDFRGRYVLVDFWASWCGPCRKENPNVVEAYHRWGGKKFTVIGISLDVAARRATWLKAAATDGLVWTQLCDGKGWDGETVKLYQVKAIPRNFLVGPDGKILGHDLRGEDLTRKLAECMGEQ